MSSLKTIVLKKKVENSPQKMPLIKKSDSKNDEKKETIDKTNSDKTAKRRSKKKKIWTEMKKLRKKNTGKKKKSILNGQKKKVQFIFLGLKKLVMMLTRKEKQISSNYPNSSINETNIFDTNRY